MIVSVPEYLDYISLSHHAATKPTPAPGKTIGGDPCSAVCAKKCNGPLDLACTGAKLQCSCGISPQQGGNLTPPTGAAKTDVGGDQCSSVCAKKCDGIFDIGCTSAKLQCGCGGDITQGLLNPCSAGLPPPLNTIPCWTMIAGAGLILIAIIAIKR